MTDTLHLQHYYMQCKHVRKQVLHDCMPLRLCVCTQQYITHTGCCCLILETVQKNYIQGHLQAAAKKLLLLLSLLYSAVVVFTYNRYTQAGKFMLLRHQSFACVRKQILYYYNIVCYLYNQQIVINNN